MNVKLDSMLKNIFAKIIECPVLTPISGKLSGYFLEQNLWQATAHVQRI